MKTQRVMFVAQGKVALEESELPTPGPDQLALKTLASVISPGTELAHLHQLENARWPIPGPNSGYCTCGTVVSRGAAVKDFVEGQRVVVGIPHASHSVVDAAACYAVPEGLQAEHAATFMLGAIALQAVRKGEVRLGQSVAVIGLGVIGNLAGQLARAAGATLVVGVDPVAWRRDLAIKSGFDAAYDSSTNVAFDMHHQIKNARGFDVVIEATGLPAPIIDAMRLTRRLGRTVLLGSSRGVAEKVDFYTEVHKKGLTVVGAHNGARPATDDIDNLFTLATDVRTVLDLLTAKRITAAPLISDTVSPADAPKAYDRLSARKEALVTVGIRW